MIVKLLTEHHVEFLSLKGGCRGWSESTHVKMPQCWKSHALAHLIISSITVTALLCFLIELIPLWQNRDFYRPLINFANSLDPDDSN